MIERDGVVVPLEIKSGKDYKRHSALNNVLENAEYGIKEAYIFSGENIEVSGAKIYYPIYMIMFLDQMKLERTIYKLIWGDTGYEKDDFIIRGSWSAYDDRVCR